MNVKPATGMLVIMIALVGMAAPTQAGPAPALKDVPCDAMDPTFDYVQCVIGHQIYDVAATLVAKCKEHLGDEACSATGN